ncbi:hypothetical protein QYE76_027929 [Lolium multiflorum]|uniref:Retrotransposon gag domain-containing protein n=1 Tax=Lolium multiflorum TaxID=4521 RepID=A0AAD8QLA9_LOLMU|nr:hypothetical protein QYE76_027929 [Lolium multiflorum]
MADFGDGAANNGFGRRSLHQWEGRLLHAAGYPAPSDFHALGGWRLSVGGVPIPPLPIGRAALEAVIDAVLVTLSDEQRAELRFYTDNYEAWKDFFRQRYERELAAYDDPPPPPARNNSAGRRRWWSGPGRTLENMLEGGNYPVLGMSPPVAPSLSHRHGSSWTPRRMAPSLSSSSSGSVSRSASRSGGSAPPPATPRVVKKEPTSPPPTRGRSSGALVIREGGLRSSSPSRSRKRKMSSPFLRRTPREKSSPAGRNPQEIPGGEIDAIVTVIKLDIIAITIIIISTIITAVITAGHRIAMDEVRKKLFSLSLSGKAAHWYKLLDNGDSLEWNDIVPRFYSKFYPPSEIHKDRNRIYNFWPHDGESIAQAWGRLKSLMLKCPIHELPGNVIIDNFYARLSFQDKTLLDTSCSGSFTRNKEEFKRDLLDRIQENTEGWENDKDRESDRKGADNPVADNLSRLENIAYDPVPVNDSFPNEQLAVIKSHHVFVGSPEGQLRQGCWQLVHGGARMHPKEFLLVEELQVKDVQGPKGEGSLEDRMEKLEQEVFKYKKMAEREVDIFHRIVSELIAEHEKETAKLWSDILSLHDTTNKLQAQLYDFQNQNCEYENRFKAMLLVSGFRDQDVVS